MILLYLLLLVATFFGGIWDNGNGDAFAFLLFFGICALIASISDKLKRNKRRS